MARTTKLGNNYEKCTKSFFGGENNLFMTTLFFVFTRLRYSPQNEKCYRQHEKQFAVSGLKSFAMNNMMR